MSERVEIELDLTDAEQLQAVLTGVELLSGTVLEDFNHYREKGMSDKDSLWTAIMSCGIELAITASIKEHQKSIDPLEK